MITNGYRAVRAKPGAIPKALRKLRIEASPPGLAVACDRRICRRTAERVWAGEPVSASTMMIIAGSLGARPGDLFEPAPAGTERRRGRATA